jgi:hypothetical protein
MAGKRLPIEVVERARAVAKERATAVPPPHLSPPRPSAPRPPEPRARAREKVVAALKRLHPMD